MQVTKRQEANYTEREMKHRSTQRIGTYVREAWLVQWEQDGVEMAGDLGLFRPKVKNKTKNPVQSSPALSSLSGLVEEDVS